ncbi:MAG: L-threonylcarbamoyladenylate synthase [Candidatus Bipolaricaulota bacterium]
MNTECEIDEDELFGPETLMVFPTDTIYGLGGNGRNKEVVDRIYRVKRRSRDKPLSLHLFHPEALDHYVSELDQRQKDTIQDLLPGPYTLILPAGPNAPAVSVSAERKVGIRVPDSDSFRRIEDYIDYPLVGTSVNKSDEPPLTDFDRIVDKFGGLVDLFIQGEEEMDGSSSTVLDLTFHPPKVLRGPYPRE